MLVEMLSMLPDLNLELSSLDVQKTPKPVLILRSRSTVRLTASDGQVEDHRRRASPIRCVAFPNSSSRKIKEHGSPYFMNHCIGSRYGHLKYARMCMLMTVRTTYPR